jgi:hypothetical protein
MKIPHGHEFHEIRQLFDVVGIFFLLRFFYDHFFHFVIICVDHHCIVHENSPLFWA